MQLSGNTILITGGTSGIGLELAKQLLSGSKTVVVTRRNNFEQHSELRRRKSDPAPIQQ